jgi:hypothetical protein
LPRHLSISVLSQLLPAPLGFEARALVGDWMLPAGKRKPLWQYELMEAGQTFLRVEDFSVYMLYANQVDLTSFKQRGTDTSLWEAISFQAEEGAHPEPFSQEELRQLADELEQKDE